MEENWDSAFDFFWSQLVNTITIISSFRASKKRERDAQLFWVSSRNIEALIANVLKFEDGFTVKQGRKRLRLRSLIKHYERLFALHGRRVLSYPRDVHFSKWSPKKVMPWRSASQKLLVFFFYPGLWLLSILARRWRRGQDSQPLQNQAWSLSFTDPSCTLGSKVES